MRIRFFDKVIESNDKEVLALNACLTEGLNKKTIQKRYGMRGSQASKILGAKSIIIRVQKDAVDAPQIINIGDNQVMDKIIHGLITEIDNLKGITVAFNPVTDKYEITRLDIMEKNKMNNNKVIGDKAETKGRKSTCIVTSEMIIEAFTQRYTPDSTIAGIASSLGVSSSTIHRILNNEYKSKYPEAYEKVNNLFTTTNEKITTMEKDLIQKKESSFIETDILPIPVPKDESIFRCGLINERHNLPVDCYVYDNCFDQKTLFDFNSMEKKAENFIKHNIPFKDGIAQKSIHLYITGLQSAMCAFMKICQRMKVNLALMHYDMVSRTFQQQIVWDEFNTTLDDNYEIVEKLIFQADKAFTYKCDSLDKLTNNSELYCLTVSIFHSDEQVLKVKYCEVYLCDSLESATEAFNKATLKSLSNSERMGTYLDKCIKNTYKFYKDKRILKTQNF